MDSKSKTTAAVLAFFIGMFGAHRFYVGKTGSAVAILLLSLSVVGIAISSIWVLIDFIMILAGNFTDKDGNQLI